MNRIIVLSIVLILSACNESESTIDNEIPNCIQNIIDDSNASSEIKTIRVQAINNELHYWLNTDFVHTDGVEYIVGAKCDTICGFCGECIPAVCSKEYNNKWTVIWEN